MQHLVRSRSQEESQFAVLPQSLCGRRGESKQGTEGKERHDAERNGKNVRKVGRLSVEKGPAGVAAVLGSWLSLFH